MNRPTVLKSMTYVHRASILLAAFIGASLQAAPFDAAPFGSKSIWTSPTFRVRRPGVYTNHTRLPGLPRGRESGIGHSFGRPCISWGTFLDSDAKGDWQTIETLIVG
jgi:hypothetical protein